MKKKLLFTALLFSVAAGANAQTTVFSQDFNGPWQDVLATGWTVSMAAGTGNNYGVVNSVPALQALGITGGSIGGSTFFVNGTTPVNVPDTDIITTSPVIALPAGEITLSYKMASLGIEASDASHYSVYIITPADMEGVTTPVQLAAMLDGKASEESGTISAEMQAVSFTISDYAESSIVVAFRLHDSPGNTVFVIDDFVITQAALGINSLTADMFTVYPNPAQNVITINGDDSVALEAVAITDINGRTVLTQQLNGINSAQLDVSALSSGMYAITLTSGKGTAVKKFIKQ
jgi:hypothetical protein